MNTRRIQRVIAAFKEWPAQERILVVMATAITIVSSYVALGFATEPLVDGHAFRQTHTALTAYWIEHDGLKLAYETPVAGAPWSIPFEFPLYEALAAGVASLTGLPLHAVGRVLSWLFLLGSAIPAAAIAARFRIARGTFLVFICLWLSSPIYLYWGRTFLIETTAVFLMLSGMVFAIDVVECKSRPLTVAAGAALLTLAVLQKVTAAAPPMLVLGALWVVVRLRRRALGSTPVREWIAAAVVFGVPLVAEAAWTRFSDACKARNALGAQLTSSALAGFHFGDWGQRWSQELLVGVVWNRVFVTNGGGAVGLALVAAALVFGRSTEYYAAICASVALFCAPLLVFTNLHILHDYYQTECALFAIAALGLSIGILVPRISKHALAVPAVTAALVASNLFRFHDGYWTWVTMDCSVVTTRTLTLAEVLKRYTPEDSTFVAFGYNWSSELAYHSGRKSFTVPEWFRDYDRAWLEPEAYLGGAPLGAIVGCPNTRGPSREQFMQRFEADSRWMLVDVADCLILLNRNPRAAAVSVVAR
jgi:hypothetical protein